MSDSQQDRASGGTVENLPTPQPAEEAEVKGGAWYMITPNPDTVSYQPSDPSIGLLKPVLGGAELSPTVVEKKL